MCAARIGFVAYSSDPVEVGQTIEAAVKMHARSGVDIFETWRQNDIAGRNIEDPILAKINDSKCLVADITTANFNVTYEIGFAIGRGRRVFLIKNRSIQGDESEILRHVGVYDTLGYVEYENTRGLADRLGTFKDFAPVAIDRAPDTANPVYLLQFPFNTDVQNRIVARIKKTRLRYRSFDPVELSRLAARDAVQSVAGAFGVIVPLAGARMRDARIHNLRAAFVAGLAHGMDRVTLLMQQGDDPIPLDYRDFVRSFKHPDQIDELIGKFALDVTDAMQSITAAVSLPKGILASLDLGASTAENELTSLSAYYLPTDQFQRALRGEARIVVGRKGAGKTAVFAQVRDKIRADRKMIVLDLRPEGYQLRKFKEQVLDHLEEGAKEHTITAFWEYLLLLEVAYKILEKDRSVHLRDHKLLEPYRRLEISYNQDQYSQEGDFSERMLRLVERMISKFEGAHAGAQNLRLDRRQVTQMLYAHDIRQLRSEVEGYLKQKAGLRVLFDNLDKGWATNGVDDQDVLIARCLLDASRKLEQNLRSLGINAHSTVFIRNDVYSLLVAGTPDRGKESLVSLDWSEPDLLRALLLRRLNYNSNIADQAQFEDAWRMICVSHVVGEDSAQYLIDRCLMRPRFLLNLINHCKSYAINFGHLKIEDNDIEKGVAAYSTDLIFDIGYEIRDILPSAEDVLYAFIGSSSRITQDELNERLSTILQPIPCGKIIETLIWYGVLGVVRRDSETAYIYDVQYDIKRLIAIQDSTGHSRQYCINPAFWTGLEISP